MNEINTKIAEIQKTGEIKMIKWKGMNINSEDDRKERGSQEIKYLFFFNLC